MYLKYFYLSHNIGGLHHTTLHYQLPSVKYFLSVYRADGLDDVP